MDLVKDPSANGKFNNFHYGDLVIAGGSSFLGLSRAEAFAGDGAEVTILSRSKPKASGRWSHRCWDGRTLGDWTAVVDGADAVVNLAGRTVDCISWGATLHAMRDDKSFVVIEKDISTKVLRFRDES